MAKKLLHGGVIALIVALSIPVFAQSMQQGQKSMQRGPSEAAVNRIQREVEHEILMLPQYGLFDSIGYQVNGYNVTLTGYVTNPTLKSGAEAGVKGIEGVEKVDNKIEVLPVSPSDDRIRLAAYQAIYGEPPLDRYAMMNVSPIHIIVQNGKIILRGTVQNESDKNIAVSRARQVQGAFGVEDQLQVAGQ